MNVPSGNERSIFIAALQRENAADRAAFLDEACGSNADLRREVEGLLREFERLGSFLESPTPRPDATAPEPIGAVPGTVIGPYQLLEQIGEGGMGLVFVAEQLQPVRRQVALKLIKPGMDTREVIARFEAERQALALMEHPNIARVLDAGATAQGRPYFVMELVYGIPLTQFCDEHRLALRARLELFLAVCQAVQHAHTKGIIHRDLKPSNLLVSRHEGTSVVKVIDFGVAKAVGQPLTGQTVYTHFQQMIGTPLYMSPEQAGMSELDIDTRTDIYALGALLYELLTGTTPLDKERLRGVSYEEIRRLIREEEPSRPSTRLSTLGQAAVTVSTHRQSDLHRLRRLFRGELDWIVMKCLEKDRNRRYETASALAADVQRYLHDEPVQACPPSVWYRFRKFARRNKRVLATTALLGMLLLVVAGSIGWMARDKAMQEARVADAVQEALEESVRQQRLFRTPEALAAAQKAWAALASGSGSEALQQRVNDRLRDLKMVAQLDQVRLHKTAVIKDVFQDRAQTESGYAKAFGEYGTDVEALEPRKAADQIRTTTIPVELAAALDDWAMARRLARKPEDKSWKHLLAVARAADTDELRNQVRDALERMDQKALVELATSNRLARLPAPTLVLLGDVLDMVAPEKAIPFLRRAQQLHPGDFWINHQLAFFLRQQRPPQWEDAVRFYTAALAIRPETATVYLELGICLAEKGKLDEAIAAYRQAIKLQPDFATAYFDLGNALRDQGKLPEAADAYRKAVEVKPNFAVAYNNLGNVLRRQGKLPEAAAALHKAIHWKPNSAEYYCNLGVVLVEQGQLPKAIAAFRTAIDKNPNLALAHHNLGIALEQRGQLPEAVAEFRKAIALKPDEPLSHFHLGAALRKQGKRQEAVAEYRKVIALKPNDLQAHFNLGNTLLELQQLPQAEAVYRKVIDLKPDFAEAHFALGTALLERRKLPEAIDRFRKAIDLKQDYGEAHCNLGIALMRQGKLPEAVDRFRKAIDLKPDQVQAHYNLGIALSELRRWPEAVAAFRAALKARPDLPRGHIMLGDALQNQGQFAEAVADYRKGIEREPNDAVAHYHLGLALAAQGKAKEAIAAYRQAIKVKPDFAEAHCNLGHQLRDEGRFTEALASLRHGHGLGQKIEGWPYPSERWVQECERLVELDEKLPAVLHGEEQPADAAERLAFADLCVRYKRLPAAAARLWAEAFADPELAENVKVLHRYNAACAAALAGSGQGEDGAKLKDKERARWREQAVVWLRADLAAWTKRLEKGTPADRAAVQQQMQRWQKDTALAGIRDPAALAKLPEAERETCRKLWADVEALLARVKPKGKEAPPKKP
jgi:tetratricopeptide (TPR) repeat protein